MEVTRSGLVCHRIKQVSAAILLTITKDPVFDSISGTQTFIFIKQVDNAYN